MPNTPLPQLTAVSGYCVSEIHADGRKIATGPDGIDDGLLLVVRHEASDREARLSSTDFSRTNTVLANQPKQAEDEANG